MEKFYCEHCYTISQSTDNCECCGKGHFRKILIQIQNQAKPSSSHK